MLRDFWRRVLRSDQRSDRKLSRSNLVHRGSSLAAETLEDRQLLAASLSLNGATKELTITGTASADIATIEAVDASNLRVRVVTGAETVEQTFANASVNQSTFNADAGDDRLTNTTDRPISMNGGDGADSVTGGVANDTLIGGPGRDTLIGGSGDDWLSGNADWDQLRGNGGRDVLIGGGGSDQLDGGDGDDVLRGQGMHDSLTGGPGRDDFDGGVGNDVWQESGDINVTLTGGGASLTRLIDLETESLSSIEKAHLRGGDSPNTLDASGFNGLVTLDGGAGDDVLLAGSQSGELIGGSGDDSLLGGAAGDWLQGQDGDDLLTGGVGNDILWGGAGSDIVAESGNVNFSVSSYLNGLGSDQLRDIDGIRLTGGASNNVLDASRSTVPTTLTGGGGNDTIKGSSGFDDLLIESADADFTLTDSQLTGLGTDALTDINRVRLMGGSSANRLDASATTKPVTLIGGDGDDTLLAGAATDVRDGGPALQVRSADGSIIANDDHAPTTARGTDLGFAVARSEANASTFRLTNVGGRELRLIGPVTITGPDAAEFAVTRQPQSDIAVDDAASFVMTFRPTSAGPRAATVHVASDDPNTPAYSFDIQATGVGDGRSLRPQRLVPGVGLTDVKYLRTVNGSLLFQASDATHGERTWRSDGTTIGTEPITDVLSQTMISGETVLIAQTDEPHGNELWKTDGTPEGTEFVKDLRTGPDGSNIYGLTQVGATWFFTAVDETGLRKLWKSDGTAAGTVVLRQVDAYELRNVAGLLLFRANGNVWKSDGTPEGTTAISPASAYEVVNDNVYLTVAGGLWKWNLNDSPTSLRRVTDLANVGQLTLANGTLFFVASDTAGRGLFKTDGTPEGTVKIASANINSLAAVNGTLFFVDSQYTTTGRRTKLTKASLWKSDGTAAGTVRLRDFGPSEPTGLRGINDSLYFRVDDSSTGLELWRSDGTSAGTQLVSDIKAGLQGSTPEWLMVVNGRLFFTADDGVNGRSLWVLNTQMPSELEVRGIGRVIANGDNTPSVSDGTDLGLVRELGQSAVRQFTLANVGTLPLELQANATEENAAPIIRIVGTNASEFVVSRQPAAKTLDRNVTSFEIEFRPTGKGLRTAVVQVGNDSSGRPLQEFTIQGMGQDISENELGE